MKWRKMVWLIVVVSVVLSGTAVAGERTIIDALDREVRVELPVERIVSLSGALSEILFVLGAAEQVVGRDARSDYLEHVEGITVVADSSASPQMEALLELRPDVVIADTMLSADNIQKLELFGVPVVVEQGTDPDRLFTTISNLSQLVENEALGNELIEFIAGYDNLISERLADLQEEERTRLFWEWRGEYQSASASASVHPRMVMTGGNNIAADADASFPIVSSEFVWQADPQVIIRMANRTDTIETMREAREDVRKRIGLRETSAVRDDRVYIISWHIQTGLRSVVANLYYAKWLHPERFEDVNPQAVHNELVTRFYDDIGEAPVSAYPYE